MQQLEHLKMLISILVIALVNAQEDNCGENSALTCTDGEVKTFLKLSKDRQGVEWTDNKRVLLADLLNYAVNDQDEANDYAEDDVAWDWEKETCRRSFCLKLGVNDAENQASVDMIRSAIYYHKDSIYGAIGFSESELVFDGVPETYYLKEETDGLEIWMIPYLVVFGLVILGICASLYSTFTAEAVAPEEIYEEDDKKDAESIASKNSQLSTTSL